MQSSGEPNQDRISWKQARTLLSPKSGNGQWKNIRSWTSRIQAAAKIKNLGEEVLGLTDVNARMSAGDCGICKFRSLRLGVAPGEFSKKAEQVFFGDLYTIEEQSKAGGWIKIVTRSGQRGWIETHCHYGVSKGEFKVLSSFKRANTLNFLVNSISTPLRA